ncbi:undecaprenyl-diphosphate phosphatase [Candidatus Saccharibacteria bacterium]|nr:undecaprenyl-diphosphate phosphatase [Candidatus Saccharibacteria bacterium]MBH2007746.1 undecaprenyl-diphosphate phosphatase [Candidatus Saccharibacteria bacterium]
MEWWHAILFGVIEGVTEFLPVSSTGHLTIAEKLLGYRIDDPDITAFTAIIQVGAVLATVLYLRRDIWRVGVAWFRGLADEKQRKRDYKFGWAVLIGSIPIGIIGLLFKDEIEGVLRSLWFVAGALILWSVVMWFADRHAKQDRGERDTTWHDTLIIGITQCLALIPGISRSGATMSAGLLRGFDRVTVTRLSFFLSIPALLAAAILQTATEFDQINNGVGWGPTLLATTVSFGVAYVAVAWLLKFIARHDYSIFIWYRVAIGLVLIVLLSTNIIEPV